MPQRFVSLTTFFEQISIVVFLGGFNADCVTDPSTCKEGFTMSFWLKVYSTGYVMSSGSFTNHRNGPGYQLYYQQSLKRFEFLLETRDKRWTLLLHEEVGLWTHMAFTWRAQNGLSYYEDGNLSTFTDKPVSLNVLRQQNYTPVITLARPINLLSFREFGKFEISLFAIWLKELSAEDVAGVYQDGHSFLHQNFVLCCHFKSGNVKFLHFIVDCIEEIILLKKVKFTKDCIARWRENIYSTYWSYCKC